MQSRKQAEKYCCKCFRLSCLLNYLLNKVIQIKTFFYNILLRQLLLQTNIENYINSQGSFDLLHHNFISDLLLSYCTSPIIKCTTICMSNFSNKKEDNSQRADYSK